MLSYILPKIISGPTVLILELSNVDKKCSINFLEYYFRDAEFKKIFLENYVFLTRITEITKLSRGQEGIDRDAEVYIRK